jgi:glycine oxidase
MSGRIVVIGGGIIGLSLAYELSRRGEQVSVLERTRMGSAASWAGVGILPPGPTQPVADPLDQLRGLSFRLHAEWAERLRAETGIDTGFRRCGGLYLARSAGEAATLVGNFGWWREQGVQIEALTAARLMELEPSLAAIAPSLHRRGIWWLPDECQLRTPWHVRALRQACAKLGVELVEDCEVLTLESAGDRMTGVRTTRGPIAGELFCIASGPWVRQLLEPVGIPTGVLPIRGQVLLYRTQTPLLRRIVNEGHRYLLPREDHRILVGSNEEEAGFEVATTPAVLAELADWAITLVPELRAAEVERSWAGLRPHSFDGLPYIGPLPTHRNAFLAAGHYRAGIALSCGTASVLADLITTGTAPIDLFPLRPGRG